MDYLKLSEIASYSKLAQASKAPPPHPPGPPGGIGLTITADINFDSYNYKYNSEVLIKQWSF